MGTIFTGQMTQPTVSSTEGSGSRAYPGIQLGIQVFVFVQSYQISCRERTLELRNAQNYVICWLI